MNALGVTTVGPDEPQHRVTAVEQLIESLESLPARRPAALHVLTLLDDPDVSNRAVSAAVGADPALSTRVLRMANSAYYGLSGRVGTISFALTVVGFQAVRSLAAAAASGITADDGSCPPYFWSRAAAVAVGAQLVAPTFRAEPQEAFCLGLLHDLGRALLARIDPEGYRLMATQARSTRTPLVEAERAWCGVGHDEACGRVLAAWQFPPRLVAAVEGHHGWIGESSTPLVRTLHVAVALADRLPDAPRGLGTGQPIDAASRGRITADTAELLAGQIAASADVLAASLT